MVQLCGGSLAWGSVTWWFSYIGVYLNGVEMHKGPVKGGSVAGGFSSTRVQLQRGSVLRGLTCMLVQLQGGSVVR